jgi:hypothetical protein
MHLGLYWVPGPERPVAYTLLFGGIQRGLCLGCQVEDSEVNIWPFSRGTHADELLETETIPQTIGGTSTEGRYMRGTLSSYSEILKNIILKKSGNGWGQEWYKTISTT